MKYLLILVILITSCNPFISPELRRKNKCNRKFEKVLRRCPELLTTKDTTIVLDTTIITNSVQIDTVLSIEFDTLEIIKDKFHLKIIRSVDTLIVSGGCDSDTIYVEKIVRVPIQIVAPIPLTISEQILNGLGRLWWLILIAFGIYILYKKYIK